MNFVAKEAGTNKMIYRINEHQLLRVWSVISSFSRIREIDDPSAQSEILTNAQMLFTAFVFDLEAVDADQSIKLHALHPPAPVAFRQRPSAAGFLLRRYRSTRPLQ
jgi:hypothetical protein